MYLGECMGGVGHGSRAFLSKRIVQAPLAQMARPATPLLSFGGLVAHDGLRARVVFFAAGVRGFAVSAAVILVYSSNSFSSRSVSFLTRWPMPTRSWPDPTGRELRQSLVPGSKVHHGTPRHEWLLPRPGIRAGDR